MTLRVCLLGFGEVGQLLVEGLRAHGARLTTWDLKFADEESEPRRAATQLRIHAARNPSEAVREADVIISAVTAAQAEAAAHSVAPHLVRGAWYLDLNSTSPASRCSAARLIEVAGGRFVEAAVMSPIAPRGAASPMLLGGVHAAEFQSLAQPLGFTRTRVLPGKLGSASAAKMCRSVFIKGLEALVLESLLAARHHGVEEEVLASLRDVELRDWRDGARYMASRALKHGVRRAEEMREAARTVREAGVEPHMSSACAAWQHWAGHHASLHTAALPELLDGLLAARPGELR
jgi:3-hydroxyisobutyrate dehydrogenase-like beta-hydroxyacid dehydrogenase